MICLHVLEKVVENPIIAVQSTEGAAQSAIQYFENMRNFLEAVKNMKLLTFEASDLEKVSFFLNYVLHNMFSSEHAQCCSENMQTFCDCFFSYH